jgi:hypothetical protein
LCAKDTGIKLNEKKRKKQEVRRQYAGENEERMTQDKKDRLRKRGKK